MRFFNYPMDRRIGRFDHLVVHCSATPPVMSKIDAHWIDNLHLSQGFTSGNGYHVVITREGQVQTRDQGYPCRPFDTAGAHVGHVGRGWNSRSFGVVLIGGVDENNKPEDNFTPEQYDALENVIRQYILSHPQKKSRVTGHRDLLREHGGPPKACPCFSVADFVRNRSIDTDHTDDDTEDATPERAKKMAIPEKYIIQEGDSLWKIAKRFGLTVSHLKAVNPEIAFRNLIYPGETIRLTKP